MAYYRVRPQLARPGFRAGWPPGPGPGHALQAHFLVDAFVGSDLAEQVGERLAVRVTGGDRRLERLALPLRVLGDERGVLVFGVVLDVGVESARSGDGAFEAVKFPREGAGLLSSLVDTDGLVELGEAVTKVESGERVGFLAYASLL